MKKNINNFPPVHAEDKWLYLADKKIMWDKISTFLMSKTARRAYWTILNVLMGLVVSLVTFLATEENIGWAVTILPFATALSQWFTKEIVNKNT